MPADSEVITGRNCDPVAISERGDDAAGRRRRILGATTTRGFLQPFGEIRTSQFQWDSMIFIKMTDLKSLSICLLIR